LAVLIGIEQKGVHVADFMEAEDEERSVYMGHRTTVQYLNWHGRNNA
jgi:hypothetical protein